ncbi:galactocerebrosidase-like isoform X2 [Amphiura filiformis]|uniref:galactocerebrosidase-like isoform X2 n=1 Tax=Amphiura filiformis TaxID=82378 RepID=UPI003B20CD85
MVPKWMWTSIFLLPVALCAYTIDDSSGLGRTYDGIGGISGGGATSRLLVNYAEPYRSQILDYLFKPNFGASLQIFKVEIGGDAQSTDGTESSHMHNSNPKDANYDRGYEWWLMKEAKKRNPDIKLYGLPWAFPKWVGNGTSDPYHNPDVLAGYILNWIKGAKSHHNLTIDYIGIWNERPYNPTYIKLLRKSLDSEGLQNVQIIAADNLQFISISILEDQELAKAIQKIGVHYPGTEVTQQTIQTGKPIWASEDYSTNNNEIGGGCWARILNQNYVNGNMTSTISWNLIASYYDALPYTRDGLMTAIEPWSGHYEVTSPIWGAAHTTQFTEIGWKYFKHGAGAAHLDKGGSYVSLTDGKGNLTIVIETMSHDHSKCIRPGLPPYNVSAQTASFTIKGSLASKITSLNVWYTKLTFDSSTPTYFEKKPAIKVSQGSFSLDLQLDEIYTLSTVTTAQKGSYPASPASAPFPVPYQDNFDSYPIHSEANNFADQSGVYEIHQANDPDHKLAMRQMIPDYPIIRCIPADPNLTVSYIGNHNWKDATFSIDSMIEVNGGVFIAFRVTKGGCQTKNAEGVYFWVNTNGTFTVTSDIGHKDVITKGMSSVPVAKWFTLKLQVEGTQATGYLNGKQAFNTKIPGTPKNGFIAIGTTDFSTQYWFDNFSVTKAS